MITTPELSHRILKRIKKEDNSKYELFLELEKRNPALASLCEDIKSIIFWANR